MLGKTHVTLGIASALAITHPVTVPGIITSVIGGAVGGWIVDVDCKKKSVTPQKVYDTMIIALIIGVFVLLDFLFGKGICQYIINFWGPIIWIALAGLLLLMIIGFNTSHRTFTHSFMGMGLFGIVIYFFCKPIIVPFLIGYVSHMILDIFNKKPGLQIFFPFKWRICFNLCYSNKKANDVLFWLSFIADIVIIAFLFTNALKGNVESELFKILSFNFLGINMLKIYLIFVNIITYLGFQRRWKQQFYEEQKDDDITAIKIGIENWIIAILVFLGGGLGSIVFLMIHLQKPSKMNGIWWSFSYTGVLLWFTIYCYICNPYEYIIHSINWVSIKHIPFMIYLLIINIFSAIAFYKCRNNRFEKTSIKHTFLWLLGAFGGTIGAIPVVIITRHTTKYSYVSIGFVFMLLSQLVFVMYMMMVGVI